MPEKPELYFCIAPKDPLMDRSTLKKRLTALDEAFTEDLPGGVGGYDFEKDCAEVWLYDESLQRQARELIEEHGFEVKAEEEIMVEEQPR